MPRFQVELAVVVSGTVVIEAESADNARAIVGQVQAVSGDITFMNEPAGFDLDDAMYEVEIDALYEDEE